jgi:hypothetical protein
MAYQSGTASSVANLLDNLQAFLAANGWTVVWRFQIASSGSRWVNASKSGVFLNFWEETAALAGPAFGTWSPAGPNVRCAYATSYASGSDAAAQPGNNGLVTANATIPPFLAYHFFEGTGESGPYVYGVIEITAGEFRHFGAGMLNKAGTYTGGEFCVATCWAMNGGAPQMSSAVSQLNAWPFDDCAGWNLWSNNLPVGTIVRCTGALSGTHATANRSAPTGAALRCGGALASDNLRTLMGSPQNLIWNAGTIHSIAVAPLMRVPCFVERASGYFSYIGQPPAFRHIDMSYLSPGDEIVLGAETWKAFPLLRKGSNQNMPMSNNYGIAYLKN